jgi:hypothetical protein
MIPWRIYLRLLWMGITWDTRGRGKFYCFDLLCIIACNATGSFLKRRGFYGARVWLELSKELGLGR